MFPLYGQSIVVYEYTKKSECPSNTYIRVLEGHCLYL